MEFEEILDHGSGDVYLLATRIHASPNNAEKIDKEGKNPEGKTTAKMEGTASTTSTTTIKCETRGEAEAEEKKTEPHEMPNCSTAKRLRYDNKQEK